MLVLIDADPIVYRCGFASEKTCWYIVYERENGQVGELRFDPTEDETAGEQLKRWVAAHPDTTVIDKSRLSVPDPVSHALRATNVQVDSIIEECQAHFRQPAKMLMWISGKGGSYRDRIATVRPYKGNRDPTHKPQHYNAIRDHLRSKYGSYLTAGIEADDAVSIFAHQHYETGGESLVIATIDKDLDQIPGQHYNYMNKVFYAITPTEAERWFAYQCIAGDRTDNIVGSWLCGEKQTATILDRFSNGDFASATRKRPVFHRAIHSGNTADVGESGTGAGRESGRGHDGAVLRASETIGSGVRGVAEASGEAESAKAQSAYKWWPAVVSEYERSKGRRNCPYAAKEAEAVAIEMAQLVKLQEYPGQLWHPYGDLVVPGFGEENFDG